METGWKQRVKADGGGGNYGGKTHRMEVKSKGRRDGSKGERTVESHVMKYGFETTTGNSEEKKIRTLKNLVKIIFNGNWIYETLFSF